MIVDEGGDSISGTMEIRYALLLHYNIMHKMSSKIRLHDIAVVVLGGCPRPSVC